MPELPKIIKQKVGKKTEMHQLSSHIRVRKINVTQTQFEGQKTYINVFKKIHGLFLITDLYFISADLIKCIKKMMRCKKQINVTMVLIQKG